MTYGDGMDTVGQEQVSNKSSTTQGHNQPTKRLLNDIKGTIGHVNWGVFYHECNQTNTLALSPIIDL